MNLSLCNFLPSPVFPLYVPGIPQYPLPLHSELCSSECSAQFILQQLAVRKLFSQLFCVSCFPIKRENSEVVTNWLPLHVTHISEQNKTYVNLQHSHYPRNFVTTNSTFIIGFLILGISFMIDDVRCCPYARDALIFPSLAWREELDRYIVVNFERRGA